MSGQTAALAERVLAKLKSRSLMVVTAESCTAGNLATLLADAPDGGQCLHGGFVVYTKDNKAAVLGVPLELVATHTAVSQPVAEAMAKGALERCPADMAIAITGVAGPEPDEDGNPVGLMHVAVAHRDGRLLHRRHTFEQAGRDALRQNAIQAALALTEEVLDETGPAKTATTVLTAKR
jgi:nicotinamide-nucleotide amidase